MYYVAKTYQFSKPLIVESFENEALATSYANIMNQACKGTYIVLTKVESK